MEEGAIAHFQSIVQYQVPVDTKVMQELGITIDDVTRLLGGKPKVTKSWTSGYKGVTKKKKTPPKAVTVEVAQQVALL